MKRLFRAAVLLMAVLVLILSAQTALAETATAGTPKTPFYIILTENMKVDYNNKAYQLKTNMIVKVIDTTTVPWKCQ